MLPTLLNNNCLRGVHEWIIQRQGMRRTRRRIVLAVVAMAASTAAAAKMLDVHEKEEEKEEKGLDRTSLPASLTVLLSNVRFVADIARWM